MTLLSLDPDANLLPKTYKHSQQIYKFLDKKCLSTYIFVTVNLNL